MIPKLVINALIYASSASWILSARFASISGVGCIYLRRIYAPTNETRNWCHLCVFSVLRARVHWFSPALAWFPLFVHSSQPFTAPWKCVTPHLEHTAHHLRVVNVLLWHGWSGVIILWAWVFGHGASSVGVIVKQLRGEKCVWSHQDGHSLGSHIQLGYPISFMEGAHVVVKGISLSLSTPAMMSHFLLLVLHGYIIFILNKCLLFYVRP